MQVNAIALNASMAAIVGASLTGLGWEGALDELARAAGAGGAMLVACDSAGAPNAIVASQAMKEPVADYLSGRIPPDSRQTRVRLTPGHGFATDYDHYSQDELDRDPFYQDYLRPRGYQWHACAQLANTARGDIVISLKRHLKSGHYQNGEVAGLNAILPQLRMSLGMAGTLAAHANLDCLARATRLGHAAFLVDHKGRVSAVNALADTLVARGEVAQLMRGQLRAVMSGNGSPIDKALFAAARRDSPQCRLVELLGRDGSGWIMQALPLGGAMRDLFGAARAIVFLMPQKRSSPFAPDLVEAFAACYGLTSAERRVAADISAGRDLAAIARDLAISPGTVRNHLKAVQAKTGFSRQRDLVSLFERLQAGIGMM